MQALTECVLCLAPFRVEGWTGRKDPYFCALCASLRKAEEYAQCRLCPKIEPPDVQRWV